MPFTARHPNRTGRFLKAWQTVTGLALVLLVSASLQAESVTLETGNGHTARGEFRPGEPHKPAVLILHGMQQTHGIRTVRSLTDSLDSYGYSVLAPTLTLGIDQRQESMDCSAIHNHTMAEDLAEIQQWVQWLAERTSGPIALVGHSTGGLKLLAYLQQNPHPRTSRLIAVSLSDFASWSPDVDTKAQIQKARSLEKNELHKYTLGYCTESYAAPPGPFLSYVTWDQPRILEGIADISIPVTVILGTQDKRFPKNWPSRLRQRGSHVKTISGAGHFFEGLHEMTLADTVQKALTLNHRGP